MTKRKLVLLMMQCARKANRSAARLAKSGKTNQAAHNQMWAKNLTESAQKLLAKKD